MDKTTIENHERYIERIALYKNFGYNIERERNFIIEKAEPLYGDILEVGTGKGHLTVALAKEGYTFTSIDISEEEQKFGRLNIKYFGFERNVDFRIENAEQLNFEDKSFDIIFSVNTIHHLVNPYKVIDEFIRVISFEGKIVVGDFTKEGLELMNKIHASEGREHQVSKITLSDIENYLINKGFSVQKHRSRFQEALIAYHQII